MALLGIDIGTTHCKAGLFAMDGAAIHIASRPMLVRRTSDGRPFFDPQELWATAAEVIGEAAAAATAPIAAIGVASMAESGLLLDRGDGAPRSEVLPWFDTSSQLNADAIASRSDPLQVFLKTGLRVTYKSSLARLLWLRDRSPGIMQGAVWLSAADYIAYRLTGAFGTDYSLAGRTCAFDIQTQRWDESWLRTWGLSADLFPPAQPAGTPLGVAASAWSALGLPAGIPVAVSGHDHVCGALAAGAVEPGVVFDSMGTAEVLIGVFPDRCPLSEPDFRSGLMVGCHVMDGYRYWMGGLSASGGSVEWIRSHLADPPLSYDDLLRLLDSAAPEPTGILFFPYLLGSGSPHTDPAVRAAFVGLSASHTRADLAKSVLEGAAYEIEFIRRAGERMAGHPIDRLTAAGGGTRNRPWLQIKADVSGAAIHVSPEPEATLLGAALAAGIGAGVYASVKEASAAIAQRPMSVLHPDPDRHRRYNYLFEAYLRFQEPLRALFKDKQAV